MASFADHFHFRRVLDSHRRLLFAVFYWIFGSYDLTKFFPIIKVGNAELKMILHLHVCCIYNTLMILSSYQIKFWIFSGYNGGGTQQQSTLPTLHWDCPALHHCTDSIIPLFYSHIIDSTAFDIIDLHAPPLHPWYHRHCSTSGMEFYISGWLFRDRHRRWLVSCSWPFDQVSPMAPYLVASLFSIYKLSPPSCFNVNNNQLLVSCSPPPSAQDSLSCHSLPEGYLILDGWPLSYPQPG